MIELKKQEHSYKPPEFIGKKQTEFLREYCTDQDVELLSVLGEEYDFVNYKVKYKNSTQYTLLHYHTDNEEHVYLNRVDYYSG
ncbi:MAG: hypothetical protein GF372_13165 [Candidatus Marinimicrobia bacterium]|nr:hypothetical protein [Candidatus Neomarinimicrobiota bacterium]